MTFSWHSRRAGRSYSAFMGERKFENGVSSVEAGDEVTFLENNAYLSPWWWLLAFFRAVLAFFQSGDDFSPSDERLKRTMVRVRITEVSGGEITFAVPPADSSDAQGCSYEIIECEETDCSALVKRRLKISKIISVCVAFAALAAVIVAICVAL